MAEFDWSKLKLCLYISLIFLKSKNIFNIPERKKKPKNKLCSGDSIFLPKLSFSGSLTVASTAIWATLGHPRSHRPFSGISLSSLFLEWALPPYSAFIAYPVLLLWFLTHSLFGSIPLSTNSVCLFCCTHSICYWTVFPGSAYQVLVGDGVLVVWVLTNYLVASNSC